MEYRNERHCVVVDGVPVDGVDGGEDAGEGVVARDDAVDDRLDVSGEELRVLDGGQGEVGGHVAAQLAVALVEELDGDGQGQLHHVALGVVLQ